MKNFLLLAALFLFSKGFAQCEISGPDVVRVGEKAEYTAKVFEPCTGCYTWFYPDQNIYLEGDLKSEKVTVKGAVPGEAVLTFRIQKTKKVQMKCAKTIKIAEADKVSTEPDAANCEIPESAISEKRISDTVVEFATDPVQPNFTYRWTVTYKSGEKKTISGKSSQFSFSHQNVINAVELEIFVNKCSKKITKTYYDNFWYFF